MLTLENGVRFMSEVARALSVLARKFSNGERYRQQCVSKKKKTYTRSLKNVISIWFSTEIWRYTWALSWRSPLWRFSHVKSLITFLCDVFPSVGVIIKLALASFLTTKQLNIDQALVNQLFHVSGANKAQRSISASVRLRITKFASFLIFFFSIARHLTL